MTILIAWAVAMIAVLAAAIAASYLNYQAAGRHAADRTAIEQALPRQSESPTLAKPAHALSQPWARMLYVVNHLLVHGVAASLTIGMFSLLNVGIEQVSVLHNLVFMQGSPYEFTLSSVFHWADLAVLLSFVCSGLWQVTKEMVQ